MYIQQMYKQIFSSTKYLTKKIIITLKTPGMIPVEMTDSAKVLLLIFIRLENPQNSFMPA